MNNVKLTKSFLVAFIAVVCFLIPLMCRAQESWDQRVSTSSWQAGSTAKPALAAPAVTAGGNSSWTAGRSGFGSRAQAGGVWHESYGFTPAASQGSTKAAITLPRLLTQPRSAMNVKTVPASGLKGLSASRAQLARPGSGRILAPGKGGKSTITRPGQSRSASNYGRSASRSQNAGASKAKSLTETVLNPNLPGENMANPLNQTTPDESSDSLLPATLQQTPR